MTTLSLMTSTFKANSGQTQLNSLYNRYAIRKQGPGCELGPHTARRSSAAAAPALQLDPVPSRSAAAAKIYTNLRP
jgi:hypothetical protein